MTKTFDQETFYTPEEIAKKMQLSLTTVYNLIKSQEIPAIRIGKCFRIRESDVSALWLKNQPIVPRIAQKFTERLKRSPLSDKVQDVILFGSYARGSPDADSDIDIIIIYSKLNEDEKNLMVKLEDETAEEFDYIDEMNIIKKSVIDWKLLEGGKAGLYRTIINEGVSLWK